MNGQQTRQDAVRATRGQLRFIGIDPVTASAFDIESAANEVRPEFCQNVSDNQWKLFIREFKKWQRGIRNV